MRTPFDKSKLSCLYGQDNPSYIRHHICTFYTHTIPFLIDCADVFIYTSTNTQTLHILTVCFFIFDIGEQSLVQYLVQYWYNILFREFLVILKRSLQNYLKISKKCFLFICVSESWTSDCRIFVLKKSSVSKGLKFQIDHYYSASVMVSNVSWILMG